MSRFAVQPARHFSRSRSTRAVPPVGSFVFAPRGDALFSGFSPVDSGRSCTFAPSGKSFSADCTVECSKLDRYGRMLGKALLDGVDVNQETFRTGHAWAYTRYFNELSPAAACPRDRLSQSSRTNDLPSGGTSRAAYIGRVIFSPITHFLIPHAYRDSALKRTAHRNSSTRTRTPIWPYPSTPPQNESGQSAKDVR